MFKVDTPKINNTTTVYKHKKLLNLVFSNDIFIVIVFFKVEIFISSSFASITCLKRPQHSHSLAVKLPDCCILTVWINPVSSVLV